MTASAGDLQRAVGNFFSLTPEHVLESVEQSGHRTTGLCYTLNSLENRVYEVELEDESRVVAKFYRPGRWSPETILDEHRLLDALHKAEIPVCCPLPFPDGKTLHTTADGIHFALFPRTGGRSPEELSLDEHEQLGRLLARIHNVSAHLDLPHRPVISPETYGRQNIEIIMQKATFPEALRQRYSDVVMQLVHIGEEQFKGVETFVIHGDCHRGNLLHGASGWFFLDFDDSGVGPAVQDIWLLLPGRPKDCPQELQAFLEGYEQFRAFDRRTLGLIEVLRALRYVRYAAWVASRWEDPSFKRAFPDWGTDHYWENQLADLYEQLRLLQGTDQEDSW